MGGDGEIIISQIDEFVGSETESARQKRVERAVKKSKLAIESTSATLSHNCRTEIDKEIDKDINKEIEKETSLKQLNSSDSVGIVKDMYYETINYNQKYLNSDLKKLKEYSEKYELTLLAILFHIVVLRKRTMGLAYANKIIESWDSKAIYTVENYYSSEESSNNPNFQKYIYDDWYAEKCAKYDLTVDEYINMKKLATKEKVLLLNKINKKEVEIVG